MTQIEKIRAMSAEALAEWLMEDVESGDFSADFCDPRFCKKYQEHPDADFDCNQGSLAPNKECIAAAVAYLESEVPE